jgi:hypothetical protein
MEKQVIESIARNELLSKDLEKEIGQRPYACAAHCRQEEIAE